MLPDTTAQPGESGQEHERKFYLLTSLDDLHPEQGAYLQVFDFREGDLKILDHHRFAQMTAVDMCDDDLWYVLKNLYRRDAKGESLDVGVEMKKVKRIERTDAYPRYGNDCLVMHHGDQAMIFRYLLNGSADIQIVKVKKPRSSSK